MTHAELQQRMSASEFAHWIAYHRRRQRAEERARQKAEDQAKAARLSRGMRGLR
jgi:hypothetical protein